MTISSSTRKAGPFTGDDVTQDFAFTFKIFTATDIYAVEVEVATGVETVLTLTTEYSVALNANQNMNPGGTVTLVSALATGYELVIASALDYLQPTDLTNQGGFYPSVITDALDRVVIQIQQINEKIDRSLKSPISDTGSGATLPTSTERAGTVLAFDSSGDPVAGPAVAGGVIIGLSDDAYSAAWSAKLDAPTRNAVYNKVAAMDAATSANTSFTSSHTTTYDHAKIPSGYLRELENYALAAAAASNAITVARKGQNGSDPSSTNVVSVSFRDPTLTVGTPKRISYTAAVNIVLPQGSTLGFIASEAGRFYVYEGTNGTDTDIGVARTSFVPEDSLFSSTAISASATSASVLYSSSARTNWVWRCVGYIEATMSGTPGNWSSIQKVQVMGPGIKRTGNIVQTKSYQTGTSATGTTAIAADDTIPQITEGDEFMTLAMAPKSAINQLQIDVVIFLSCGAGGYHLLASLFQGTTANALASMVNIGNNQASVANIKFSHYMIAGTTSEITFRVRGGSNSGGTTTFNGYAGSRIYGGALASSIKITEVFA